jgi:hypothetical protein
MLYFNSPGGTQKRPNLRQLLPKFETSQQVRERQATLVNHLKAGKRASRNIGRKLRRCRKNKACGSPSCPRCLRRLRRLFVRGAMTCIDRVRTASNIPRDQIVAFSAVLTEERYVAGDLHNANLNLINERVQRRHQRTGLPLVLAGVDISWNEDSAKRWEPHWQLQVYGVCVGLDRDQVKARIAKHYPANDTTPRPLRVRTCKNLNKALAKALSYTIKPYFGRRVNYFHPKTSKFRTRKVSLKRPQAQELATWIDQYPLTARHTLTGCRRYGDGIELTR